MPLEASVTDTPGATGHFKRLLTMATRVSVYVSRVPLSRTDRAETIGEYFCSALTMRTRKAAAAVTAVAAASGGRHETAGRRGAHSGQCYR